MSHSTRRTAMAIDVRSDSPTADASRRSRSLVLRRTPNRRHQRQQPGETLRPYSKRARRCGRHRCSCFRSRSTGPSGPKLTHTIAHRDLKVTVTEQGTLESSNNTEVRCKVKGANSTIVWIIENGTEVKPGDELVRLDTSTIEDNINTQEIAYQNALATYAQSEKRCRPWPKSTSPNTSKAPTTRNSRPKRRTSRSPRPICVPLRTCLNHAREMYRKGFMSKLELEGNEYSLQQAELELEVKETELEVLTLYAGPNRSRIWMEF